MCLTGCAGAVATPALPAPLSAADARPCGQKARHGAEELGSPAQLALQGGVVTEVHVLLAYSFEGVLLHGSAPVSL